MTFNFHAASHRGMVRANNEDALSFDADLQIALLADGMGGYKAGEVASRMAIELVLQRLGGWLKENGAGSDDGFAPDSAQVQRELEEALEAANRAIYRTSQTDPDCSGMGTTLVAAVFLGPGRLLLAHLGDSRCYRLRNHVLAQLTRDHSLLQEQLDAGLITPLQAMSSANRNLLTRALGIEDAVQPEIREYAVAATDLYLLCSDGLHDMLDQDEISAVLDQPRKSLADRSQALIALANAHGGRDNVSVLLAQGVPPRQPVSDSRPLLSRWLGL